MTTNRHSLDFVSFFNQATKSPKAPKGLPPHPWQQELGSDPACCDRLIRIPTGFGKTAGVVLTWLFHRLERGDSVTWPTRLAYTLPMRTLVEQTESEVRRWLDNLQLANRVRVHVLMGGAEAGEFHLTPEQPAIIIGTQDMLVSRALNRGYGAHRPRWPIDFGLLQQDALWIFDEVQLMDVALATTAQLAAFRRDDAAKLLRPTYSWWMSATLQPKWLKTVDWQEQVAKLCIPASDRTGGLWEVKKSFDRKPAASAPSEIAELALAAASSAPGKIILVVLNTVQRAVETFAAIENHAAGLVGKKGKTKVQVLSASPDLRLVHSRFRGSERSGWREQFLRRDATVPAAGRIIVATQVVEAGVDLSALVVITDLAPWPSLVQRFGRAARYEGESGSVVVVGAVPSSDKEARPYTAAALTAAAKALDKLVARTEGVSDVGPRALEVFEEHLAADDPNFLEDDLYPYRPDHLIRRRDLDDLFDTSPDLSGADIDVSRWVRSGDERDVSLFWRPMELGLPDREIEPKVIGKILRTELCPAPIHEVRKWLESLKERQQYAFVLDYLSDTWKRVDQSASVVPGMVLLLPAVAGGYGPCGFMPASKSEVPQASVSLPASTPAEAASERLEDSTGGVDNDDLSIAAWQTIAQHGRDVGDQARSLAMELGLPKELGRLLALAGRWHDVGKSHGAFQAKIKSEAREREGGLALGSDVAKAPKDAWKKGRSATERRGFRHELASLCALFETVRLVDPWHQGLLGGAAELLTALGSEPDLPKDAERLPSDHPLARELAALGAKELNLVAYLVLSHHGKLRTTISASPLDQDQPGNPIAGVRDGDTLPEVSVATEEGHALLPAMPLSLALANLGIGSRYGASWPERVAGLIDDHGPFALAFLESLLRAADVRASIAGQIGGAPQARGPA